MSFTLEKTFNWLITDPVKILTKKTFQIVKYKTLQHALFFLSIREIGPSTAENSIMVGGTVYKAKIKITLGR
jgi:ribosomal protein S7